MPRLCAAAHFGTGGAVPLSFGRSSPLFLAAFSFARNSRKTPQPEKPRRRRKFRRQKWKRFLRNIGYPAFKTERKRQAFGSPLPGGKVEIAQKLRIHVFLYPPIFPFPYRRKIGAENERRSRRRNPLPLPLRCRRFQISAPPICNIPAERSRKRRIKLRKKLRMNVFPSPAASRFSLPLSRPNTDCVSKKAEMGKTALQRPPSTPQPIPKSARFSVENREKTPATGQMSAASRNRRNLQKSQKILVLIFPKYKKGS